jgi:hypothetical protein
MHTGKTKLAFDEYATLAKRNTIFQNLNLNLNFYPTKQMQERSGKLKYQFSYIIKVSRQSVSFNNNLSSS